MSKRALVTTVLALLAASSCDRDARPQATPVPAEAGLPAPVPTAVATPTPTALPLGPILVLRDGDLHVIQGGEERQITQSGDFLTGLWSSNADIVAVQGTDWDGSMVTVRASDGRITGVAAKIGLSVVDGTPEAPELIPSPDRSRLLRMGPNGLHVIDMTDGATLHTLGDTSRIASVESPGDVEVIEGRILDWCCPTRPGRSGALAQQ